MDAAPAAQMRRLAVFLVIAAALLAAAGIARAELVQSGSLRLAFNGAFEPHALPRQRSAPVTLSLSGSIVGLGGRRPPQVRRFSIAVNRYGRLFTRGLAGCRRDQLEQSSSRQALARCGGALVGRGSFAARIEFPGVSFPERGRALAFNGRAGGRQAILLQIYGSRPVEATVVLVFRVSHPERGRFGTVFSTTIPKIASDLGYITEMRMSFARRYRFGGRAHSFLSARCAAPAGFPGTIFSLARGRFAFADGRHLSTTLTRDCRVR
jgi:hypothetical protein